MNADRISAALGAVGRIGAAIEYFDETDSTNSRALDDVRSRGARDGTVYAASRQSAGRGSGGKAWSSADGLGLCFSVVLLDDPGARPLPFLAAVAIADVLRDLGVDAHLKWPNDVLVGHLKIAGILIEAVREGDRQAWVIGAGINVNQTAFPPEIRDIAVSARGVLGKELDRVEVLAAVLRRMDDMVAAGADLVAAFRSRCRMIDRDIEARREGRRVVVRARDVDDAGHLLVETASGEVETWVSATDLDISPRYL